MSTRDKRRCWGCLVPAESPALVLTLPCPGTALAMPKGAEGQDALLPSSPGKTLLRGAQYLFVGEQLISYSLCSFRPGTQVTKLIHIGRYHRRLLQTLINGLPQRLH